VKCNKRVRIHSLSSIPNGGEAWGDATEHMHRNYEAFSRSVMLASSFLPGEAGGEGRGEEVILSETNHFEFPSIGLNSVQRTVESFSSSPSPWPSPRSFLTGRGNDALGGFEAFEHSQDFDFISSYLVIRAFG
jgi:hypothetical protein